MHRVIGILTLCIQLLVNSSSYTQSGITFLENKSLADVIAQAKKEDKKIFIDTYTKWCLPCKNLDIVFTDKALGDYFNQNFVNVKFDMDKAFGKEIHRKYGVVFVPTMLLLNKNGFTELKFESSNISSSNLLQIAKKMNEPALSPPIATQETHINKEPNIKKQKVNTPVSSKEERVLYVLGNHNSATPEQLKQEAYFRLQLMDGSHLPLVSKYLDGQTDWLEPGVMRFIYDFLYDTDSRVFSFFVENKLSFENVFGTESIHRTLSILIEKKLLQAIPRPDFDAAQKLYAFLDPSQAKRLAKKYMLNRVYAEKSKTDYLNESRKYLKTFPGRDAHELSRHASVIMHNKAHPRSLDYAEALLKEALLIAGPSKHNYEKLSLLYLKKGDVDNARLYKEKAKNAHST